jgi:Tfp pilus assembly protein PilW
MVKNERGFTLVEFMIAALITTLVLGGSVMLASQLQQAYTTQLDDATVEEEARFSLDWIEQALRNAGSNPYSINSTNGLLLSCAGVGGFVGIDIDPNGDAVNDDIRIRADINPPNGLIGGAIGTCDEENEDLLIEFDDVNLVITRQDVSVDVAPVVMTEPVITALQFAYFLADGVTATANENQVAYIRVRVTGKSLPKQNLYDADDAFTTTTLETMVRVRTRS